jgi:hypothetical protein
MKKVCFTVLLCIGLLAIAVAPVESQSNGTLRGIVKDSTGAILPGAGITLTNKSTGIVSATVSTEAGAYSFVFLPPGAYSLTVDMPGFRRLVRDNVSVRVAETVAIDVQLEVGNVTEQLTVTGEAPLVQATTSSLGRAIEQIVVTGMPLSSRNFTQILALSPGASANVPNAGGLGRNSTDISSNGARPLENSVIMNGLVVDNVMSLGFGDTNDKTGIPVPSPDAIQEFKVQGGLYDAEYGRQGGANVNIVTRTGSNDFHGSAFEFFRNDALNANEFFRNRAGQPKSVLKQNQFGGTLGGRIARDETFFFLSYQGTRQRNGVSGNSIRNTFLPVLGDRSPRTLGTLYGGRAGVFGGVPIAADGSNINPIALAVLNARLPNGEYAVPDPQTVTPNNLTGQSAFSFPAKFTEDQVIFNIDHAFQRGDRIALKTMFAKFPQELPFSAANVPGFGEVDKKANIVIGISETHAFSPTFFNEFRMGYNRTYAQQKPLQPLKAAAIGLTPAVREFDTIPSIAVTGLFQIGPQSDNFQEYIIHGQEIADTASLVKGRHSIRFGGSVNPYQVKTTDIYLKTGSISFQTLPDFLLGMSGTQNGTPFSNINSSSIANGIHTRHPRFVNFALFAQDDVRFNSQLTVNAGLRYQFNGQQTDARGQNANFDSRLVTGVPPPEGTFAGLTIPSNANVAVPPGFTKLATRTVVDHNNWLGFSPRLGIAYRPVAGLESFVMRAGYGIYWAALAGTMTQQAWFGPWYISNQIGGATASEATFQNPFPAVPQIEEFPAFLRYNYNTNNVFFYVDPTVKQPYTQQWSLNFQQGFANFVAEVGYVGSKSTHILGRVFPNRALLASPESPINGQTTNTLQNINLRTPVPGLGPRGLNDQATLFDSNYHSLQTSLKKQYSGGSTFLLAYTYSHSIDNADAGSGRNGALSSFTGDFQNRAANRASSSFDRRHRFVASYVFELPRIAALHGAAGQALNGWAVSGLATLQSGLPFSITDSTAATIFGATSYAQFANGKSASDAQKSGRTQDRLTQYFDTTVFGPPPAIGNGTGFGNAGRNILTGPGQVNFDLALRKAFAIRQESQNVEFRTEFFNVFNHSQFGNPGTAKTSAASFGVISSTVVAPRIIQFALKYQF